MSPFTGHCARNEKVVPRSRILVIGTFSWVYLSSSLLGGRTKSQETLGIRKNNDEGIKGQGGGGGIDQIGQIT
jgi:hypothetical protein